MIAFHFFKTPINSRQPDFTFARFSLWLKLLFNLGSVKHKHKVEVQVQSSICKPR